MHFRGLFNRSTVVAGEKLNFCDKKIFFKNMATNNQNHLRNIGIMPRAQFIQPSGSSSTFSHDENLPNLPLPKLEDTLDRYFRSLLPFGNENELKNSKKLIEEFKNGTGKKLHKILEEKASNEKNWIERFWEEIGYCSSRTPFAPTQVIFHPLMLRAVGVTENEENRLKNFSRIIFYFGQFFELIRTERLQPSKNPDGSIIFSSDQYKRLFNTSRIPGEIRDKIQSYFTTERENKNFTSNVIIFGNGKIFSFDIFRDGKLISPQEILFALSSIKERIKSTGDEIPILTCDERTQWAKNRKYLMEISPQNPQLIDTIESSLMAFSFDEREPKNLAEICEKSLDGTYNSRWMDKSVSVTSFKNGKFGCIGEHTCYDGPSLIGYASFILSSFYEDPQLDWTQESKLKIHPREIKFKVDEKIQSEVKRVEKLTKSFNESVAITYEQFKGYGKRFMKDQKVHPDCYVQMALQLAYFKLHEKLAPTYETATMRMFYHGRTETVRSCSIEVNNWLEKMNDSKTSTLDKAKLFREAANSQYRLMNDARKGKGIDRHLFALWCISNENKIPVPSFYEDPLYSKSGGGGNFVLSTSTLGYTISNGGMAPMILDGYGTFYTMLDECIWLIVTTYRDSKVTSSSRFYESFVEAMNEIKELLEASGSKL